MTPFSGYYAALLTPFSDDGEAIAEDALGRLVRRNIDTGLSGLYVGGSTGEAFLMSPEERARLMAVVVEAAAGDTRLIAHVGDVNPSVSLSLAREAARLGYDAVSAVPPFYYGYGFAEIRAHYERLACATDLPFLVYNFPALSGVKLSPDQLAELLSLKNVVGIKNTCADLYAFERLRRAAPEKILLHGFDETLLSGVSLGADGGIGSTYNVQAGAVLALARAFAGGRMDEARRVQSEMNAFIDILVRHGVIASLKHIVTRLGIPMGPCRAPFLPLGAGALAELDRAVDKLPSGADTSAPRRATAGE